MLDMSDWARSPFRFSGLKHDPIASCGPWILCAAELFFRSCRKIQARQPYSPPAAGRRQSLAENRVRSHRKALPQHADTHGCTHEHTGRPVHPDTTPIANKER
jgi:hypothetical protein